MLKNHVANLRIFFSKEMCEEGREVHIELRETVIEDQAWRGPGSGRRQWTTVDVKNV